MSDTKAGPYREAPPDIRYLCTVCYVSASTGPATCPRDGAPLLPLDNAEVVAMLRQRAGNTVARKRAWLTGVGVVVSAALAVVVCMVFGLELFPKKAYFGETNSWFLGLTFSFSIVWFFATMRVFDAPADDEPLGQLLRRFSLRRL